MKKTAILCLILCLLLSGCASSALPETASDGTPWAKDWVNLGAILGVEPMDGWTSQRNEDVLAAEGMYFAAWSYGDPSQNDSGETVYPAQIFLVISEQESDAEVSACLADWEALVQDRYTAGEAFEASCNSGDFDMIPYLFPEDSGNFTSGMIALGSHGNYAINAELSCRDDFTGDPGEVLTAFLKNIHYAN